MKQWNRRSKILSFRCQVPVSRQRLQDHWRGFTWQAGPVVVSYVGDWGKITCWAASLNEGQRVIGHACVIAAIPISGTRQGEWVWATAKAGRNGKPGRFVTATLDGYPVVTARPGPSGLPELS